MPKFVIVSRDFDVRGIGVIKKTFKDSDKAWEHVEQQMGNTNTQQWVLTEEEARQLKEQL